MNRIGLIAWVSVGTLAGCAASSQPAVLAWPAQMNSTPSRLARVMVSPTKLSFDLDPKVWHEQLVDSPNNDGVVAKRSYSRDRASTKSECPAGMAVIAERVSGDVDVVSYSAVKRVGMPPHRIEKVFSHLDGLLGLRNAIGYRIRGDVGCHPVVYLVHVRDGEYGLTIVLDVDPQEYAVIEPEVLALLKSFSVDRVG
jgi:hypothetical protein